MSKSLGTGIDPLLLIEKYGADATRFGTAWQIMGGQDIRFVEDNIVMGRKFCNKIWNASRFVMMQIGNLKLDNKKPKLTKKSTPADKKILKALDKTVLLIDKHLDNFQFGQAARQLYSFFWHDFCDLYIEKAKKQENKTTKQILFYVLLSSLKLLHPFIPFVTEEIYQGLPMKNKKKCLIIEDWPK
jgi:valyl-tRNA synthetase